MKIEVTRVLSHSRELVWDKLRDFDVLGRTLPGAQKLTPITAEKCEMSLKVLIPAITGKYAGTVEIADQRPPEAFRLIGRATGRLGWVKGDAEFRLSEAAEGTQVDAVMTFATGGPLAAVGGRFMEGIAKGMTREFLDNFDLELRRVGSDRASAVSGDAIAAATDGANEEGRS